MTTRREARQAIYLAFKQRWETPGPGPLSTYVFDNERVDVPDDQPWVRLSVRHQSGGQETLGKTDNRKFYRRGAAMLQVFTASNVGADGADVLVQAGIEAFEGLTLAGTTVRFLDVSTRELGVPPGDTWYQVLVEAEFEYDETR